MSKQHIASTRRARGFTLIELMVGISVLGVLLAVGVPAFTDIIRTNRVASQTNDLVAALSIARVEASRRGIPMSVCAANAGQTACEGDNENNWQNGWMVFSDRAGAAGTIDAGDQILEVSKPVGASLQLTSGGFGFVRFAADGRAQNNVMFSVRPETCTGTNMRRITLELTGRINSSRRSCT